MTKARISLRASSAATIAAAFLILPPAFAQSGAATGAQSSGFTIEQALSAPYCSELTPAPARNRVAWVANIDGRRNLWVAEPAPELGSGSAPSGSGFRSRQITHYDQDDGQEIDGIQWSADAATIVYVRGDSVQGESHPVPNPAWFPKGAQQQIWAVAAEGGEPRLLAEGHEPAISPDGKELAYIAHGQIWLLHWNDPQAKPEQLLQTRGAASALAWSPDGARLAFVSNREDHSFVAVYTFASNSLSYLDPSTDRDLDPVWSPDSARIAFLRIPGDPEAVLFEAHRTALPWSIRVADAATGKAREAFRAAEGQGSAYRETGSPQQLQWAAGDRIVFPWERDGWLHLYAVAASGGEAEPLTPGEFEVEHVALSADRKTLVFDSNRHDAEPLDFDRRHVWSVAFAADGAHTPAQALTGGEGIETQPVVLSDGATVAVLRSDARLPIRPAWVRGGQLADLAPQAIPAGFPASRFVVPRQAIFNAADGLAIHGQLFLPANLAPGERRPAMVFFHGGSQRQMLLGWHYLEYYSNAYAMNQYLASLGYIVLSVNYRSGIGYGLNFREALNYGATGASEFNDVLGAGLYLRGRPDVDPARIGSWGGSYGGYLTALALARASDLFAAGVDMHGVHDWNGVLSNFSPNYDPQKRADFARLAFASSPMASVATWRSPVLLIHGDDDRNVPFDQTEMLVEALRKHRVEFEQIVFPDEIHDFLLRRDWVRAYSAGAEFLARKLARKNPPTAASAP